MEEFIRNQRRGPRVPVRLAATVSTAAGEFAAETEDVGPGGCRLTCAGAVAPGDLVRVSIHSDAFTETLRVSGKVAWRSTRGRLRAGVRFDDESRRVAAAWFERLLEKDPSIAARFNRVPSLLPFSAPLHPAVTSVSPAIHTDAERALFAEIVDGMTVRELLGPDGARRRDRATALFALLATRAVTIETGEFRLRVPPPRPESRRGAERSAAAPAAGGSAPGAQSSAAIRGTRPPPQTTPGAPLGTARPGASAPPARGSGARPASRPPDAQEKFEAAQRLAAEGKMSEAIPLLREALKTSPRDAAIAALLARAAFGAGLRGR